MVVQSSYHSYVNIGFTVKQDKQDGFFFFFLNHFCFVKVYEISTWKNILHAAGFIALLNLQEKYGTHLTFCVC